MHSAPRLVRGESGPRAPTVPTRKDPLLSASLQGLKILFLKNKAQGSAHRFIGFWMCGFLATKQAKGLGGEG